MEEFFASFDLSPGEFSYNFDLALMNLLLGLGNHSTRQPCAYGHWVRGTFAECELMTFEGIREWYDKWIKSGGKKQDLKEFFNCVDVPISIFPLAGLIIDYLTPPELHLMEGATNKLYTELKGVWPEAEYWSQVWIRYRTNRFFNTREPDFAFGHIGILLVILLVRFHRFT